MQSRDNDGDEQATTVVLLWRMTTLSAKRERMCDVASCFKSRTIRERTEKVWNHMLLCFASSFTNDYR